MHNEMQSVLHQMGEPPYEAMAILATVMLAGWAMKRWLGQPMLVGMLLAGFAIGPSGLGYVAPSMFHRIFPAVTMAFMGAISKMGLTFYQGLTGFDFDPRQLRGKVGLAALMAFAGIAATFGAGIPASWYLYRSFCDPEKIHFWPFALYASAGMSLSSIVTIGYILKKSGLHKSPLAGAVMAAALFADVVGWIIVCFVDAFARSGNIHEALPQIAIIIGFILIMAFPGRWLLSCLMPQDPHDAKTLGMVVLFTLIIAAICERIGIHPLFGSFVLGAVMPKTPLPMPESYEGHKSMNFSDIIVEKLEPFEEWFFLPLFLGYSGLRSDLWTLLSWKAALGCLLVCGVAVGVKFVAITLASYLGQPKDHKSWAEAGGSGGLLIALGLMGLMVVNMAMDAGQFNTTVFTIMVIPGLASTVCAYPLLDFCYLRRRKAVEAEGEDATEGVLTVEQPEGESRNGHPALVSGLATAHKK